LLSVTKCKTRRYKNEGTKQHHTQDGRPSSQGWYFETSLEHHTVVGWVYRYYTGNVTRNFFSQVEWGGTIKNKLKKKSKFYGGADWKKIAENLLFFREASTDTNKTYTRDKITDAVQWGETKSQNS
jgi:hypothetical protein